MSTNSNNDENRTSKAWVWSQYRGVLPGDAPSRAPTAAEAAETRERPPLIPEKSGAGLGPLLALLILVVAGLAYSFSMPKPAVTTESATAESGAETTENAADAAPSEAETAAAPTNEAQPAEAEAKTEPKTDAAPEAPAATRGEDKIAAAKERLAALPSSGALDAASCEAALNATVTVEKIQFRSGRAAIDAASTALLDRLAGLLKRCPDAKAEIDGYTDNVGAEAANRKLAQRRASAVADYLKKAGVSGGRLSAVGRGPSNPIASNETDEGRAENRRIEFTVK